MTNKNYSHKVSITDQRRQNKRANDVSRKGIEKKVLQSVFESYYKDQVRALYRAVSGDN
jgi:lysine/ornithine N-monooxygenase